MSEQSTALALREGQQVSLKDEDQNTYGGKEMPNLATVKRISGSIIILEEDGDEVLVTEMVFRQLYAVKK